LRDAANEEGTIEIASKVITETLKPLLRHPTLKLLLRHPRVKSEDDVECWKSFSFI